MVLCYKNGASQIFKRSQKKNGNSPLRIYYQNVKGFSLKLGLKLGKLRQDVACNDYDIIILVESWLNKTICHSEVFIKGFSLYRCDTS